MTLSTAGPVTKPTRRIIDKPRPAVAFQNGKAASPAARVLPHRCATGKICDFAYFDEDSSLIATKADCTPVWVRCQTRQRIDGRPAFRASATAAATSSGVETE